MYCDFSPLLIGFQVFPPSSVRKAAAAEIAMYMRPGSLGSRMIVWRHIPPAPGCHLGPVPCPGSPEIPLHFFPPSLDLTRPRSPPPSNEVWGWVRKGPRSHTRLTP